MTVKFINSLLTVSLIVITLASVAQNEEIVFKNVRVFDGTSAGLSDAAKVYIADNNIIEISGTGSKSAFKEAAEAPEKAQSVLFKNGNTHELS